MATTAETKPERRGKILPDLKLKERANAARKWALGQRVTVPQEQVVLRHRREIGIENQTPPLDLGQLGQYKTIVQSMVRVTDDLLNREMGLSSAHGKNYPHEGISSAEVIRMISGAIENSQHAKELFKKAAIQKVNADISLIGQLFAMRDQGPNFDSEEEALIVTRYLLSDSDTLGGVLDIAALEQLAISQIAADHEMSKMTEADMARHTILFYIVYFTNLNKLKPELLSEIKSLDSLKLIELAYTTKRNVFERMLFHGLVDETIAQQLSELLEHSGIDINTLLTNSSSFATATVFHPSPLDAAELKEIFSPVELAFAHIVRRIVELGFIKAVQKVVFKEKDKILEELIVTLNRLAKLGRFRSEEGERKKHIKEMRNAYQNIERYLIDKVMTIGDNLIDHAVASASHKNNPVEIIKRLGGLSEENLARFVDDWTDEIAITLAERVNLGNMLPAGSPPQLPKNPSQTARQTI